MHNIFYDRIYFKAISTLQGFFSLIFLEWREKRVLQDWNGVSLMTWCYSINRNYMEFPQTHVSVLCWIAFSPFLASKNNNSVSNMWKKVITFFINVLLSTAFSELFRVATSFFPSKVWLYDHCPQHTCICYGVFLCLLVQYIQGRILRNA